MSVLGEGMYTSPYVSPKPISKIQHNTKNANLHCIHSFGYDNLQLQVALKSIVLIDEYLKLFVEHGVGGILCCFEGHLVLHKVERLSCIIEFFHFDPVELDT